MASGLVNHLVVHGIKTAHQIPNRMWEMKREAARPPYGAPSNKSKKTKAIVAAPALITAHFKMIRPASMGRTAQPRPESMASPPTNRGNLIRASAKAIIGSLLQKAESAERTTKPIKAHPDTKNLLEDALLNNGITLPV